MKVYCPISGVSFTVDFPTDGHATYPHPMLSMPAKQLTETFLGAWVKLQTTSELTHLLGLAYICKLPIVALPKLPSDAHETMQPFWAKNMERLAKLACSLEGKALTGKIPRVNVSADNLVFLEHWVSDLTAFWSARSQPITDAARKINSANSTSVVTSPTKGSMTQEEIDSLIIRGLKGSPLTNKESQKYPELITRWVTNIAPFPVAKVTLPSGKKTTITQHWQHIMETAFSKSGALDLLCEDVNLGDLEELLEHCYENIPIQTGLMASLVWKKLEEVKSVLEEFRGGSVPTAGHSTPKTPKINQFKGNSDELLALISDETPTAPVTEAQSTGLTLQQKLALKLKANKAE